MINRFVWAGKKLRIKAKKMYLSMEQGALAVPDVMWHCDAFSVNKYAAVRAKRTRHLLET